MKILIIEDEILTADSIEKLLIKNGHEIKKAKNNKEAMILSETFWPELAIVDIHLKHSSADGIEIATDLKTIFKIPIIFLTGKTDSTTFSLAKKIQPLAYLIKPFNPLELVFQIEIAYEHFLINKSQNNPLLSDSVYFPDKNGHRKIYKKDVCYLRGLLKTPFFH